MKFPWRREKRQASTNYADAVVQTIQNAASGEAGPGDPQLIAAVEIAASLWGRAFAAADVKPESPISEAVTPGILAMIGRGLVRRGESLFVIEVEGGDVRLDPAETWTVEGGHDPASWRYEVTRAGPSRSTTNRFVKPDRVIHVRYAVDPARPWAGVSPLAASKTTATLAANLEAKLADEVNIAPGAILPTPDGAPKDELQADLRAMRGRVVLVDSTASGWGTGAQNAPKNDLEPNRIGADPPATLPTLRNDAAYSILAACGVPPELLRQSQGTGRREAWRQFLHATIDPVAREVAGELAAKLEIDGLTLDFDQLHASDISGRARAFQSMVGGGMDVTKAATLAGLMESE